MGGPGCLLLPLDQMSQMRMRPGLQDPARVSQKEHPQEHLHQTGEDITLLEAQLGYCLLHFYSLQCVMGALYTSPFHLCNWIRESGILESPFADHETEPGAQLFVLNVILILSALNCPATPNPSRLGGFQRELTGISNLVAESICFHIFFISCGWEQGFLRPEAADDRRLKGLWSVLLLVACPIASFGSGPHLFTQWGMHGRVAHLTLSPIELYSNSWYAFNRVSYQLCTCGQRAQNTQSVSASATPMSLTRTVSLPPLSQVSRWPSWDGAHLAKILRKKKYSKGQD